MCLARAIVLAAALTAGPVWPQTAIDVKPSIGPSIGDVTIVPGPASGAPAEELVKQLKSVIGKLEDADPATTVSPSEWISVRQSMQAFLQSETGKSADDAAIEAFAKVFAAVQTGDAAEKAAFAAKTAQLRKDLNALAAGLNPVAFYQEFGEWLTTAALDRRNLQNDAFKLKINENYEITVKYMGRDAFEGAPVIADSLKQILAQGGAVLVSALRNDAAQVKRLVDLNTEVQKVVGSSDLRVHVLGAAYGERAILENFVRTGRRHTAGQAARWCNATAAVRTKCERKGVCTGFGEFKDLCGYEPAEFVAPRHKGVMVEYVCLRDSDAGFWLRPSAGSGADEPVAFGAETVSSQIIFLSSPAAQLACEVAKQ